MTCAHCETLQARLNELEQHLGVAQEAETGHALSLALRIGGKQLEILQLLYARRGAIVDRKALMKLLNADPYGNTVSVHIHHIRKWLGHEVIELVKGVGYRLSRSAVERFDRILQEAGLREAA